MLDDKKQKWDAIEAKLVKRREKAAKTGVVGADGKLTPEMIVKLYDDPATNRTVLNRAMQRQQAEVDRARMAIWMKVHREGWADDEAFVEWATRVNLISNGRPTRKAMDLDRLYGQRMPSYGRLHKPEQGGGLAYESLVFQALAKRLKKK